jgi:hypothetical protein
MRANFFGTVKQNGYVVRDLDAAIKFWTEQLGVGPFFKVAHLNLEYYEFKGVRSLPDMSVGVSYLGDLQIELIEQHNDAPSHYLDFLNRNGPGLHHIQTSNDEPLETNMERLARLGHTPTSMGGNSQGRFVYFDFGGHAGSTVELVNSDAETNAWFDQIRRIAAEWDGSDPVRIVS